MFYLMIGSAITFYLYYLEKYKTKYTNVLLFIPALFYFIGPAFQFHVGTDYSSYIWIYETQNRIDLYYHLHHEYFFYYLIKFLQYFALPSQSIFIVFSFIHTVLMFTILIMLKKYKFKMWLIFFLFFIVSTIYFNQMNGLRQYVAVLSTPILLILVYEQKYFKSILLALFALFFHKSFLMIILLIPFFLFLKRFDNKRLFQLSLMMPFVLFFFLLFKQMFIGFIPSIYDMYLNRSGFNPMMLITKGYYVVFVYYFWYLYLNKTFISSFDKNIFKFMTVVLSITWCIYLIDVNMSTYGRLFQYFNFFYIFPLYYIIEREFIEKNYKNLVFIVAAIILPFFLKILVFPVREYSYNSMFML